MAMKLVTKFLVRHNFQTCAELFWSPVNLEMRHDECFTADYRRRQKPAAAVILLQAKIFFKPRRKLRKEKQQEFVFHPLFFFFLYFCGNWRYSNIPEGGLSPSDDPNEISYHM